MSRKLLSLLVAVAFVLTTISTGFAATVPSDVTADFAKAVSKLSSLNIMAGYPDGTFKPDQTITRAEFAKIAVVAMGLKDAAAISAGSTSFKDVAADNWASGYINVAASQGIITGYPDGTFKPDQTINYAEALTILTKMLGYGPVLAGKPWPAAYVGKAADVGITSGVVLSPTVGASRGNVAKMMSNTLDTNLVVPDSYDDNGKPTYKVSTGDDNKLMAKKLSVKQMVDSTTTPDDKEFFVSNTPIVQGNASTVAPTLLDDDTPTPDAPANYVDFADGLNPNDYLGLKIKGWVNDDKKIVVAEVTTDAANIYDGVISKDDNKIKLEGKNQSYAGDTSSSFVGYINASQQADFTTFVANIGNDKATARVVLDNGKIVRIYAWAEKNWATTPGGTYTSKEFTVEKIEEGYIKAADSVVADIKIQDLKDDVTHKDKRIDVIRNGVAATLDDIKVNDVVSRTINNGYQRWIVTSNTADGALTAISGTGADMTLTIGGKDYTLGSAHKFSFNNGDDYNKIFSDNMQDIMGKTVSIRLNSLGQIQNIVSNTGSKTYYYGIYVSSQANVGATGGDKNLVIFNTSGTKVSYILEDNTNSISANPGDLIQYQLTTDGKVKDDSVVVGAKIADADLNWGAGGNSLIGATTNIDDNKIQIGTYVYSTLGSTVIFDVYDLVSDAWYDNTTKNASTGEVKLVSFGAIKNKFPRAGTNEYVQILRDGITVKYVAVYYGDCPDYTVAGGPSSANSGLTSSTKGIVLAKGYDTDGQTVTVNEDGTVKIYKLVSGVASSLFNDKAYVKYTTDNSGKINSVTNVGAYAYNGAPTVSYTGGASVTGAIYKIKSIDTATNVIKVNAITVTDYMATGSDIYFRYSDSDTQIYDASVTDKPVTDIKGAQNETILGEGNYIWVDSTNVMNDLGVIVKLKRDNLKDN